MSPDWYELLSKNLAHGRWLDYGEDSKIWNYIQEQNILGMNGAAYMFVRQEIYNVKGVDYICWFPTTKYIGTKFPMLIEVRNETHP